MANQENRVYVGNIPFDTTESELRDLFKAYKVVSVSIPQDRDTGRARGFAFVELESPTMAEGVVTNFDATEFGGRTLKISIAHPREDRARGGSNGDRRQDRGRDNRNGGRKRDDRY